MITPTLDETARRDNERIVYWTLHYNQASPEIRALLCSMIVALELDQVGPFGANELLERVCEKMQEVRG